MSEDLVYWMHVQRAVRESIHHKEWRTLIFEGTFAPTVGGDIELQLVPMLRNHPEWLKWEDCSRYDCPRSNSGLLPDLEAGNPTCRFCAACIMHVLHLAYKVMEES